MIPLLLSVFVALVSGETNYVCDDHHGYFQSPINIDTRTVVQKNIGYVSWSDGYKQMPKKLTLTNTGHTFNLKATTKFRMEVNFPSLPVTYQFAQLHFHWGDQDYKGSEHTINNASFPIEMHVVNVQTVDTSFPKYLVVGFFFNVVPVGPTGLEEIVAAIPKSTNRPDQEVGVNRFKFTQLFVQNSFSYYCYDGSLTTPPFEETVKWVVAKKPLLITRRQLNVFRDAAKAELGMFNNYRCPQDLENREVIFNA